MERKVCVMDIDGTLLESFKSIYMRIITDLFGNNKIIMGLNSIFYKINDFDIASNNMIVLKFVILLFSILSFSSFKRNIEIFKSKYVSMSKEEIIKNYNEVIIPIEKMGYDVYLVSPNEYTLGFQSYIPSKIIVTKSKTLYILKNMVDLNVAYIIGNNLIDDIFSCFLLDKKYKKSKKGKVFAIYIGKSNIVKKIIKNKAKCFQNLKDILRYIDV